MTSSNSEFLSSSERLGDSLQPLAIFIAVEIAAARFAAVGQSYSTQAAEILLALGLSAGLFALLQFFDRPHPIRRLAPALILLGLVLGFVLRGSFLDFSHPAPALVTLALFALGCLLFVFLLSSWLRSRPAPAILPWVQGLSLALPVLAAAIWLRDQFLWLWPGPTGQTVVMLAGPALIAVLGRGFFGSLGPSRSLRLRQVLGFGLLGALLLWTGAELACEQLHARSLPMNSSNASPPVILITLDAMRDDALDLARAERRDLLADLVADSVRFTRAMSASNWTKPSLAALLTGFYPSSLGVGRLLEDRNPVNWTGIPASAATLPQALAARGYQTAAFVDNPWLDQEFAGRFQLLETGDIVAREPFFFLFLVKRIGHRFHLFPNLIESERLTNRVLRWLRADSKPPFFLWLHYLDPHLPYLVTPATSPQAKVRPGVEQLIGELGPAGVRTGYYNFGVADRAGVRLRYLGEAASDLIQVERLLRELKRERIYDQALIILTADHGEEFWEHGNYEHGHSFHQEVLHVPLLIKFPHGRYRGRTVAAPVDLTAIAPTVLAVLGQTPGPDTQGADLAACLERNACPEFWMSEVPLYYDEAGAYGTRDLQKIILHGDGSADCYRLDVDPKEASPLPCGPELINSFQKQRRANLELRHRLWPETDRLPGRPMDEETRARLRALGYVP
jgi:hypothetical protein